MATQVHNLFHFVCMDMGMGASVLIARYWGTGEKKSLSKTLTLMYRCCLLVACIFTIIVGLAQTTTLVLRNSKQMQIPLYTSMGAFFVNIFFNWVFIFGKLGTPAMGVAGAALIITGNTLGEGEKRRHSSRRFPLQH